MFVTINRFEWGNPHNQIYFELTDEKSVVSRWSVETKLLAPMSERYRTSKSLASGGRDHGFVQPPKIAVHRDPTKKRLDSVFRQQQAFHRVAELFKWRSG
jgi:hypothetical protein